MACQRFKCSGNHSIDMRILAEHAAATPAIWVGLISDFMPVPAGPIPFGDKQTCSVGSQLWQMQRAERSHSVNSSVIPATLSASMFSRMMLLLCRPECETYVALRCPQDVFEASCNLAQVLGRRPSLSLHHHLFWTGCAESLSLHQLHPKHKLVEETNDSVFRACIDGSAGGRSLVEG